MLCVTEQSQLPDLSAQAHKANEWIFQTSRVLGGRSVVAPRALQLREDSRLAEGDSRDGCGGYKPPMDDRGTIKCGKGGLIGGKARGTEPSAEERSNGARKAVEVRWTKMQARPRT